ncbi:TonB family protein [Methylocapsa palsarum]|uniref:Protein TonB n=1 Tax=Methylocapsa palsarum TaxID=1612308 RepID=A0A1I3W0T9_9HYPH|nr:TonB family protein [Methylocapsa palsarum]SFK00096.1 protein TonB [Methylocapsa palsarum]
MTSAVALIGSNLDDFEQSPQQLEGGSQSLLALQRARPSYLTQGLAVGVYALALAAAVTHTAAPKPPVEEEALELVMLPPAVPEQPIEEPPPPVAEETPPEEAQDLTPPVVEEPPVAPVIAKPQPKPKPKPTPKPVEHAKPADKPQPSRQAEAPRSAPAVKVPPNAIPSGYFNQVSSRVAHAAQSTRPAAALARHEFGRVGYRIVISPSGSVVSVSVSSSGHADLDAAARQALARAAPFPAFGGAHPVAVSGGIQYR